MNELSNTKNYQKLKVSVGDLNNIYNDGELEKEATISILETAQKTKRQKIECST